MNPSPQPPEYALSVAEGEGQHAKDYDWVAKNIPCQVACPADTDIPGYLEAISHGDYTEAYRLNLRDNVFPAVLGRVCTRPCEPACRHGWEGLGDPVAICFAKRSADDFMERKELIETKAIFPSSGKSVAVVGAGPAGLTVARQLVSYGHAVSLYDQKPYAGGNMVDAIPDFRLPREVVHREVAQALMGVELKLNTCIGGDIAFEELDASFDAVVIAAGTLEPVLPDIPGVDLPGVEHGVAFLNRINRAPENAESMADEQVVVIGGGFTAVDCARMAKRLGASKACMYYRRLHTDKYITELELGEFMTEGIDYEFQVMPLSFNGVDCLESVTFARTEIVTDSEGVDIPVAVEGSEFTVPAQRVLLGTGQQPTEGFAAGDLKPGWFKTGDFSTGARSLIDAIGLAKSCALEVDRYLMAEDRFVTTVQVETVKAEHIGRTREMDAWPREPMPVTFQGERGLTTEVETGLLEQASKREASRCYLCNYKFEIDNDLCIYCDKCLKVMPVDKCIVRISSLVYDDQERISGYVESKGIRDYQHLYLDQNQCIRCGACVEVCPVDCISLQKVTRTHRPV